MKITPAALKAASEGDIENAAITAATPGGIEAQEAKGQSDFVNSESLPIECPKKELEAMGVIFGEDINDLFVSVILPDGWSKKTTDHSMWSELLNDKGEVVANIFYKAVFYDQRAKLYLKQA